MMDYTNNNGFPNNNINGQVGGMGAGGDLADGNSGGAMMDQELLRRLAASRTVGLQMGQGGNTFGNGNGPGMLLNTNQQFSGTNNVPGFGGGMGNTTDASRSGGAMMNGAGQNDDGLLLQLLLARTRRPDFGDFNMESKMSSDPDELMRLRQAGNASAASAAMFVDQEQPNVQQLQQQQMQQANQQRKLQQQQQQPSNQQQQGAGGGFPGMFNPQPGLNFSGNFMFQHQMGGTNAPQNVPSNMNVNNFPGSQLDNYLRSQQNHQEQQEQAMLMGARDQQRVQLSPPRVFSLQQQQGLMGDFRNRLGLNVVDNRGQFGVGGGDLEKMDRSSSTTGTKKKRLHKKKPSDMPRRPLSAYNLFFSEERERILQEIEDKDGKDGKGAKDKSVKEQTKKPRALLRPLLPSEKKRRPHRKTHGKIGFRDLAQMVGQRWKALPFDDKKYYQDLAKEDMVRQKKAMEEYYLKQSEKVKTTTVDKPEDGTPSSPLKEESISSS